MREWTAADISAYDQSLAAAGTELDRLVLALQISTSKVGEHQAMANLGILVYQRTPAELMALLMTALRRLATENNDSERTGQ
jgi:hypothetical protein